MENEGGKHGEKKKKKSWSDVPIQHDDIVEGDFDFTLIDFGACIPIVDK